MTKQIIVIRRDLKMRRGKEIAQSCHASMGAFLQYCSKNTIVNDNGKQQTNINCEFEEGSVLDEWLNGKFTKVCVYVNSEEELIDIYNKAQEMKIPSVLITDCGLTEFHNVPTHTCVGIGPYDSEIIDTITGNLPLY